MPCGGAARRCAPRPPRRRPRRSSPGTAAAWPGPGRTTDATTTRWWATSAGRTGSRPSSMAEDSSAVSSTTSARRGAEPHDLGRQGRPVRLDEPRLDRREGADRVVQQAGAVGPGHPGVDDPVAGDDLHAVVRVPGERGEQQRGVHGGIEAGRVADPAGAGARGVEDDDDPAVLLRLPRAHDEVLAPGGGAPVDRAHVVALDVVAQAVELGALAAGAHGGAAVELAQHGEPARQVPARRERVQRAHRPGHLDATAAGPRAPAGPSTRTVTRSASRSPRRVGTRWVVSRTRSCGRDGQARARRRGPRPTAATRRAAARGRRGPRCW